MNRVFLLAAGLMLASCGVTDWVRPSAVGDAGGSVVNRGAAERACLSVAREEGFVVRRVAGSREVSGSGGIIVGRDVMLLVQSGEASVELRCSYTTATAEARIMAL